MKLLARDAEDLQVVSAALQDSVISTDTLRHRPDARAFELVASRYRHESDKSERVLSALRVDGVLDVKFRGIDRTKPDAFTVLLEIERKSAEEKPGGHLTLVFAGGGEVRLHVEDLELRLADVGPPRRARATPSHA